MDEDYPTIYVTYACKYGHRTSNVVRVSHNYETTVWYCIGCKLHYRYTHTATGFNIECITQKEYDIDVTMALL